MPQASLRSSAPPLQVEDSHPDAPGDLATPAPVVTNLFLRIESVGALGSDKRITQYAHSAWLIRDAHFSETPQVMTQTADGYLWFGTNIGLMRFDGVRFTTWNPPAGQRLLDSRVFSLLGARDGSLWIGTGYSVSHWKAGELINYPQLSGRIEALVEDNEGSIWLARTQATDQMGPLCRIKDAGMFVSFKTMSHAVSSFRKTAFSKRLHPTCVNKSLLRRTQNRRWTTRSGIESVRRFSPPVSAPTGNLPVRAEPPRASV